MRRTTPTEISLTIFLLRIFLLKNQVPYTCPHGHPRETGSLPRKLGAIEHQGDSEHGPYFTK